MMRTRCLLHIRPAVAALGLALAGALTPVWASQTVHLTLMVNGTQIEGDSTAISMDRENTIECLSFTEESFSPRDPASGAATGKRQYLPITITKRIDKSSPLLHKAFCLNEEVTEATFRFYRPNPSGDGTLEQYFTVQITGGAVTSIRRISPDVLDPVTANRPPIEEITFVFRTIRWTYEPGGVEHSDSLLLDVN